MIIFCCYAVFSALLVGIYRWLAVRYRWLDAPNHRSSHTVITPRGAGIIFALLIVGAALWLLHSHRAYLISLSAGLAVALVGWCDDLRGVSARLRFAIYTVCSIVTVAAIFTDRTIAAADGSFAIALPLMSGAVAAIGLVWLINLYNFMDGINGIAAAEALFVLSAVAIFAPGSAYAQIFISLHWLSAAAIIGFLAWNFPAGKVFMGDAGSAFLGFLLGLFMLWSYALKGPAPAVWLILLGIFIVDSGYTLLVRFSTKQKWYTAHRLHAYQRLTDRLRGNHTLAVGAITLVNVCWLFPMAWLVQMQWLTTLYGLGIAYLPLIAACYWLKAGIPTPGRV